MSVAELNVSERSERVQPRTVRWAALAPLVLLVAFASSTNAAPPTEPSAVHLPPPPSTKALGSIRSPANPDDYYPAVARNEGVSGYAVVEVDLDALGKLVDVRVLEVEPADPRFGFAEAALQVARNTKYVSPQHQASYLRFKVKFGK